MLQLSTDLHFHFELLRLHPLARYSSADISKVLEAASLVTPGDFSSFHHVFNDQSLRVFSQAEQIDASRHPISAREAYFRPSTYFRAADFYLHGNPSDFRMIRLLDAQIECFDKAIALLPNPGRRVLLKSEGEEGCSAAERSDGLGAITFLEMIERLLTIKPLGIIV